MAGLFDLCASYSFINFSNTKYVKMATCLVVQCEPYTGC